LRKKIETILSRNVTNSRGRDFYDVYILLTINKNTLSRDEILNAIHVKAEERGSLNVVENYQKHLRDISGSPEISKIWVAYTKGYSYAKGIALPDVLALIAWVFEAESGK
jgi:hypothetical protein